jgi:hypothetical protein
MAKQRSAGVLNGLLGKKVLFQGRFDYGVRERLQAMAESQQGLIAKDLNASVDYVVLANLSGGKGAQKKKRCRSMPRERMCRWSTRMRLRN